MDLYLRESLSEEPLLLLDECIQEALKVSVPLPHAMNIATVNKNLKPSNRVVLLKSISDKGLVFVTDYQSAKGMDIEENPNVSVTFWWAQTNKQIRVEGDCIKVDTEFSDDYFSTRPRGSQISASVSNQSEEISSYDSLVDEAEKFSSLYKDKAIPRPKRWGGYLLRPKKIEYWQDMPNRLHKRELFIKKAKEWQKTYLSP